MSDISNSVGVVHLNTDYTPIVGEPLGTIFWDEANETASIILRNGVIGQLFQEMFRRGQNDTAGTLANGSVATYAGSIGNSGNYRVENTVASASEPVYYTLGIFTEPVAPGAIGKITTFGKIRGIQTDGANYGETWVDGDRLFKSATISGGLTNVKPEAPIPAIPMARVISAHPSNGTIEVDMDVPKAIQDLSDVDGTAHDTNGQILVYSNTNGYWDANYNINDYTKMVAAPAATGSDGTAGEIAYDSSYIYVCVATNTWKRALLETW